MTNPRDLAFPVTHTTWPPIGDIQLGLTKREYFAAMALQGLCIAENRDMPKTAAVAVAYADALIAALSKVQP